MNKEIENAFHTCGYSNFTEVQEKAIPLMEQHKNLFVQAKTGAGKTYAFVLPAMKRVNVLSSDTSVLIVSPTRELAVQTGECTKKIADRLRIHTVTCIGGIDLNRQINALRHHPHIVIGTPGRICDLIERGAIDLSHLSLLILDEADQIITTGQKNELQNILSFLPKECNTACFSATDHPELSSFLPKDTERLILNENKISNTITSYYYLTTNKREAIFTLFEHLPITTAIVFTNYKNDANEISESLNAKGILSSPFSSFLEERKRLSVLRKFKEGKLRVLVATDAAARGLDITEVSHIIHYDIPMDAETFIHRSGRTAHQGNTGTTIALMTDTDRTSAVGSTIVSQSEPLILDSSIHTDLSVPFEKKKKEIISSMTIRIHAGRKDKIRPKDVIGALCTILPFEDIGVLEIQDTFTSISLLKTDVQLPPRITIKGKSRKLSIQ